jgi:hypothetical protein
MSDDYTSKSEPRNVKICFKTLNHAMLLIKYLIQKNWSFRFEFIGVWEYEKEEENIWQCLYS